MPRKERPDHRLVRLAQREMLKARRSEEKLPYSPPLVSATVQLGQDVTWAQQEAGPSDGVPPLTLREVRSGQGMTVEALAERSGISEATIYRIEHGKTRPRTHVVRRLAEALRYAPWKIAEFRPVLESSGIQRLTRLVS